MSSIKRLHKHNIEMNKYNNIDLFLCPICKQLYVKYIFRKHYYICFNNLKLLRLNYLNNTQNTQDNIQQSNTQNNIQQSNTQSNIQHSNTQSNIQHSNTQINIQHSNNNRQLNQQSNTQDNIQQSNTQDNIQQTNTQDNIQQTNTQDNIQQTNTQDNIQQSNTQDNIQQSNNNRQLNQQSNIQDNIQQSNNNNRQLSNQLIQYQNIRNMQIQKRKERIDFQLSIVPFVLKYDKLLYLKRIVLVGPSNSLIGNKQQQKIDSYDLVVRLNKSLPLPNNLKSDIGSRTDILYNSFNLTDFPNKNNIDFNILKKENIKYICCPYPPIDPFITDILRFKFNNNSRFPFHHINTNYYKKIYSTLKSRPNTGICAILDILNHNIKELYITGITFFLDLHYKEYSNENRNVIISHANNNIHNQQSQIILLRKIILIDRRVKIDNILDNILFNKYDQMFNKLLNYNYNECLLDSNNNYINFKSNNLIYNISIVNKLKNINMDSDFNIILNENNTKLLLIYYKNDTNIYSFIRLMNKSYYKKNKNIDNQFYYINKNYYKHIKKCLNIINHTILSPELFILLYCCIYFNKSNIKVNNLNFENQEEYYLYKYLQYRNIL